MFKNLVPKGLFGRSLIILITPVILIQMVTTYIFIDRHLEKVTQLLAYDIAGKIAGGLDVLMVTPALQDRFSDLQNYIWQRYNLELMIPSLTPKSFYKRSLPYRGALLEKALQAHLSAPFQVYEEEENFYVRIETLKGTFIFRDQLKHLYPRTTSLLLWWSFLTPIFFLLISVLFLKNQIRPLRRLSKVVDNFGRGREDILLKPTGSFEIRTLTENFNKMCKRINRHMMQRTEMLAGVSHDLRTPLTRMELQLTMMSPSQEVEQLHEDVREMTRMIEDFLAFARGEEGEEMQQISLNELLQKIIKRYDGHRVVLILPSDLLKITCRPNAFGRCLTNILNNALKYAPSVKVSLEKNAEEGVIIYFDDDGPGIPPEARKKVFKPFFRLEQSRNSETGGVGLGLSIARDIVQSHGGTIDLETSPQSGLRVCIKMPA